MVQLAGHGSIHTGEQGKDAVQCIEGGTCHAAWCVVGGGKRGVEGHAASNHSGVGWS